MNKSAIATLVERTTGYVMLLHLPQAHGAVRPTSDCCANQEWAGLAIASDAYSM